MQTLEALPFITRSVRAIYGDKPYRLGPSTVAMRQNPYGSRTMDNPDCCRIPMANRDPRHTGLFAAAFATGYITSVLDADIETVTLSALTGPFGIFAGKDEPITEGGRRPLFHIVAALAELAGQQWRAVVASDPSKVLSFKTENEEEATLWIVNLSAQAQSVDMTELVSPARAIECARRGHDGESDEIRGEVSCNGKRATGAFAFCRCRCLHLVTIP